MCQSTSVCFVQQAVSHVTVESLHATRLQRPQLSSAQYVASVIPVIYMPRKQGQFAVHEL
jgi:hypothetical protein